MKSALIIAGLAVLLVVGMTPAGAEEKKDEPAATELAAEVKTEAKTEGKATAKKEEEKKPVASGPLDGKSFVGKIAAKGKKANSDTFIFKDGRFRSTACDKFGFQEAAYTTSGGGEDVRFRASAPNPSGARMEWDGTIRGDKLKGTAILNEPGKSPVENRFEGKIIVKP